MCLSKSSINKTNRGSGHRKEFVMSALNSDDDDFINECAETHFHKQASASFVGELSSLADDNPEKTAKLVRFILDPTSHLF